MGIINLDDIQPGMTLGADLRDYCGRILLSAGSKITEKHLRTFKMWGVIEADINGLDKEEVVARSTANLDPSLLKEAEAQIRKLFRHTDLKHPFISELFRLCTLHMVRNAMGEENHVS